MTLTTHALVGAAVVSLVPQHPVLGICAALASHFVIDAIPHWDYPIASSAVDPDIGSAMKYDKALFIDVLRIGSDAILGLLLSLWILSPVMPTQLILVGAIVGMLPDPLQFVAAHFQYETLTSLQKFHKWIHTKYRFEHAKGLGIFSQVLFIALVVMITRLLA